MSEIDRMEGLIQTLLKIARLEAGAVVFTRKKEDLVDSVGKAIDSVRFLMRDKQQRLNWQEPSCPVVFCHDGSWIEEAVANVIKNAINYTPNGGEITIRIQDTPEMAHVIVSGTGIGIHDEMRGYSGLAPRYVRRQFRRSLLTSLGIVLAVALIAAVGSLAEGIRQAQISKAAALGGSHHAQISGLNDKQTAILERNISLSGVGIKAFLGSAVLGQRGLYANLEGWNEKARKFFGLSLNSGRFPEKPGEVAMEAWALKQLGIPAVLGEEFELAFEHSYRKDGEYESFHGKAEFTLVGVLNDIPAAKATGLSLALVPLEAVEQMLPKDLLSYDALVEVRPGLPVRPTIGQLQAALGVPTGRVVFNEYLLRALGDRASVSWPVIFLAVLTTVVATAAIYSIFHISVLKRVRDFGMLRCIGATPAQVRRIVFLEVLLLNLVAVPTGLAGGIGAAVLMARTISVLADMVQNVVISVPAALFPAAVGFVASFFAVWHPAHLASMVSPLEAVRPERRVLGRGGHGRTRLSVRVHRLLGITGGMAYENLWRNGRRTWVTMLSMCLGVVMFITYSYYATSSDASSILEDFIKGEYSLKADVRDPSAGYGKNVLEAIRDIPGVKRVIPTHMSFVKVLLDDTQITPEDREGLSAGPNALTKDPESGKYALFSMMYAYDSSTLDESSPNLVSGEIDVSEMESKPVALLTRDYAHGIEVGDTIQVTFTLVENGKGVSRQQEFTVGGILNKVPISVGMYTHSPQIVVHESMWTALTGLELSKMIDVVCDARANQGMIESQLAALARAIPRGTLVSYAEETARLKEQKRQIDGLMYGLIAVVSIIGLVGIINAITTNLVTRTREFGTLRAVGMTIEQLQRMVRLEGTFYGIISAFWGALVGSLIAYALYLLLRDDLGYVVWAVPWSAIDISCLAAIVLGILATAVPLRRATAISVVQSVRSVE